ncbi:hypothetical protein Tco_1293858 [Tanacetum coccineum]
MDAPVPLTNKNNDRFEFTLCQDILANMKMLGNTFRNLKDRTAWITFSPNLALFSFSFLPLQCHSGVHLFSTTTYNFRPTFILKCKFSSADVITKYNGSHTPKKGTTYVGYTSQSTPMLKTTGNSSKKDNLSMSNSFSALNEEEEEDVENVYDESANLIQNTKAGGSSSFTAAAG